MDWIVGIVEGINKFAIAGLNGYGWICLLVMLFLAFKRKRMKNKPALFLGTFALADGVFAFFVSAPYRTLFTYAADKVTKDLLWYLYHSYFVHIFFIGLLIICLTVGRTNRHKLWYVPLYWISLVAWLAPFFITGINNGIYLTVATSSFILIVGTIIAVGALKHKLFAYEDKQEVKNA